MVGKGTDWRAEDGYQGIPPGKPGNATSVPLKCQILGGICYCYSLVLTLESGCFPWGPVPKMI